MSIYVCGFLSYTSGIELVSVLEWYRLFVGYELTRRVSRWVKADRSYSPIGGPEHEGTIEGIHNRLMTLKLKLEFGS